MAQKTLTFQNRTLTYAEWDAETGIPEGTLRGRIKMGWSVERTLTEKNSVGRRKKPVDTSLIGMKVGPNNLVVREKIESSDNYIVETADGNDSWIVPGYRLRNPDKLKNLEGPPIRARYYVTSPDNVEMGVTNLKTLCDKLKLDFNKMLKVADGLQANHQGWKCRKA
ncbi:hypothetical protein IQ273_12890 [Nodosilinea sp. LEGE 07298]|uniref:hypothetical protein n=1 Tax=Nodosilinea sp. LEGE 07298 TaxID=2777970 RepID=UPI0018811FDD|nr:hypothetical protein [Nodosilinea sp. LEGE 07298]MBE9110309.1 hypothetical protein [Nodosilinea sp. LEGE 07298]